MSTVEQFRLSAGDAMERKDATALANQVFFLKRSLPVAWVSVVDSSGTVLMDSEPRAIAAVVSDPLSLASLAYADRDRPLVRRLWSADDRPVLDVTLPVFLGSPGAEVRAGYVRIGFLAGERRQNWAEPSAETPPK